MEEKKSQTVSIETRKRDDETMEQWLARALREAAVEGNGLSISTALTLGPQTVKRLVMPVVDEQMLFAAMVTADSARQNTLNMLYGALVCLHPEKFPPSGADTAQETEAQPAGAPEAPSDPAAGPVVPLSTADTPVH